MQGRLSLADGSIYDGMWRYGKRSGLGTFYLCNGDVFQGSWRDDIMHGKVRNPIGLLLFMENSRPVQGSDSDLVKATPNLNPIRKYLT